MIVALKIIALILCVLVLIVTFKTEYALKTFFRVKEVNESVIMRTKTITLSITVILFIVILFVFR